MTERELITDTLIHKQFITIAGRKLINYLYDNDRAEDALKLARRCARHDDSKFESDEMQAFLQLPKDGINMKDAEAEMREQVKKFVAMHWKHNKHHPEFWEDYRQMEEVDIMEMVVDWYARSLQFGTDFKKFVSTRQRNRFHFDKDFYKRVWNYCLILDKEEDSVN